MLTTLTPLPPGGVSFHRSPYANYPAPVNTMRMEHSRDPHSVHLSLDGSVRTSTSWPTLPPSSALVFG